MSTDSGTRTIKIDLDFSDNNRDIEVSDLVQKHCFESLEKQVQADLTGTAKAWPNKRGSNNVSNGGQEKYPPGSGLVYFIDGTRGAGKSTFLRTAYQTALALNKDKADDKTNCLAKLAYIDPSRIENNEIILLSVLKALKEKVECKSGCQGDESKRKDFRTAFKKLAGGLSLFSDGHHQLKQLDPELFLDLGLDQAGHSIDLRKHLHVLFDLACQMLNVDALLLAFDDADTNAKHAHKVLECIRCYLDTPRLVILVTGDMELYSQQVRHQFYTDLGHGKHDQGVERTAQRIRMVDHLEDQYLLKLFPIRRRLQLRPLWNLLEKPDKVDNVKIKYALTCATWQKNKIESNQTIQLNERDPKKVLNELIRRGLRIKVDRDVALYREFLLKQPLRSVLQVLSRCAPYLSADDSTGDLCNEWRGDLSEALRESLRAMALGSLYKFGVDVDAIASSELPDLIGAVFELAIRDGDMDTAAYLRPQPSDQDLKNCFVALSADVAGICAKNPATLIQYLLAGPGSVALFGQARLRMNEKNSDFEKQRKFQQYMGLSRNEDALNWARHATSILISPYVGNNKTPMVRFGVIGLHKEKPDGELLKDVNSFKTVKTALDGIIKDGLQLPVFALSLVDISGTSNRTYASIFNILGLMGRLLRLEPKNDIYDVSSVLPKPHPALSISTPEWEGGRTTSSENEDEEWNEGMQFKESTVNPNLSNLIISTQKWLVNAEQIQKNLNPSAIFLGKIWTRLYFSLEKVSDSQRGKFCSASLMEIFALCVINAFYVEETDHHLTNNALSTLMDEKLDRTNPLTSTETLIRKLNNISERHEQLPLTYLIATCPLIIGLLYPDKETKNSVNKLLSNKIRQKDNNIKNDEQKNKDLANLDTSANDIYFCDDNSWNYIEKIFIHGVTWAKKEKEPVSVTKSAIKKLPVQRLMGEDKTVLVGPRKTTVKRIKKPATPSDQANSQPSEVESKKNEGLQ